MSDIEAQACKCCARIAWTATDEAVFALQGNQLLKYDTDLKLVKQVDLPGGDDEASADEAEQSSAEAKEGVQKKKMKKMMMCEQMMKQKDARGNTP